MNRLFLVFFSALIPIVVNAYDIKVEGIYYNLSSDGTKQATVTFGDKKYEGNVIIPSDFLYGGIRYTVVSIGEKAFYDCNILQSVSIPETVTDINGLAFCWCSGLNSINIPNSVNSIEWFCFAYCTNLTTIHLPERLNNLGYGAFSHCSSLLSVILPNGIIVLDRLMFEECQALKSVILPDGISEICSWAFYKCSSLSSIILPKNLTIIKDEAFSQCTNLTEVYCNAIYPPMAYSTSFEPLSINHATLYVPGSAQQDYQKTTPWCYFSSIVGISETAINITKRKDETLLYYSIRGQRLSIPQRGINIISGKKYFIF